MPRYDNLASIFKKERHSNKEKRFFRVGPKNSNNLIIFESWEPRSRSEKINKDSMTTKFMIKIFQIIDY